MNAALALRKAGVVAHVTTSVGWFGAVAAFLAVAIQGIRTTDRVTAAAAYVALQWIAWFAIVPSSIASLATGIIQSLATSWGLFRHYWVIVKLVLTVVATALLLVHTRVVDYAAEAALHGADGIDFAKLRVQLAVDAAAGLVALLIITVLAVYKPRGLTSHGRRSVTSVGGASG
jgi:hypothetical protein